VSAIQMPARSGATGRRSAWSRNAIKRDLTGWAFISPWVLGFLGLTAFPFIASIYLSLTEYALSGPPTFIGLENFRFMFFEDRLFGIALKVTLTYAAITIPLGMVQSVMIAILLNQKVRAIPFFRTAFYIPAMISGVGWYLVWTFLLGKNGAVNWALGLIGVEGPSYLNSTTWALPSLALMSLFRVGGSMLIILAALQGVPDHLYEAVDIDGGGELAKLRHVTIPQISPAIFYNLVMSMIGVLQSWMAAFIMTEGGPRHATLFYGLLLYRNAFEYFRMGYACALGWIAFVIVLGLTGLNFLGARLWVFYEGEEAQKGA
jgi:multiple sugar transport system permease protein